MCRVLLAFSLPMLVLFASAAASADGPHPRRGRVMFVLSADEPAVVVRADAVWAPAVASSEQPVSVCGARGCARVSRVDTCVPPACPGGGRMLVAERDIADVDDFPEGLEAWGEEIDAMEADPEIGPMVSSYRGTHPDEGRAPDGWRNDDHEGLEWEMTYGPSIATTSDVWQAAMGGTVSLGFRFVLDTDAWDEDVGGFFETLFGDTYGADLRVRYLRGLNQEDPAWLVTVGVAPVMYNAVGEGRLRVPALPYGFVVPELGVVARADRDAAFYVGWSAPVAVLVTDDVGVELRGSAFLVDAWAPGDDEAEWLLTAELTAMMR